NHTKPNIGGNPLYFIQKKQKSKTSFTGAFDFLVQKGLMGQPLFLFYKLKTGLSMPLTSLLILLMIGAITKWKVY
ncbi:hypothetical protein, partial [Staphylococcus aureus]|uniref:hypothetical protein n=1 Tax=Staphylococcus aureus TaxID=1280 RepID=UPI003D224882